MFIKHRECEPVVDAQAYIAPTAVLAGSVRVKGRSRIMYGAVLDSEGSRIEIGECTILCEHAVVRATAGGDIEHPVLIGDNVFIGPRATLLGCTIETCAYIATGATVLHGAIVRPAAVVAVGALVHANAVIPRGAFIPPNTVAIGDPVKIYGSEEKEAVAAAIRSIGFAKVAFGIEGKGDDLLARCAQITEVRSREFGGHFDDVILRR